MKFEFIENLSIKKFKSLFPKLDPKNIKNSDTNGLIIDYGLFNYTTPELLKIIKQKSISHLIIKITSSPKTKSVKKMKTTLKEIYHQTYNLKICNPFLIIHAANGSKFAWLTNSLPTNLILEPTNTCNLECVGCREIYGVDKQGFMQFEDFKQILLQFNNIDNLSLFNRGDPLLHPDIVDFISFAKKYGVKNIELSTNFNINNDSLIKNIASSKLDSLVIGLDGASKFSYQTFRKGGNFNLVISNINKLKSFNPNCKITIQFLPNKFNEHEIQKIKALCRKLGVDFLRFKILNSFDNDFLPTNKSYRWEQLCKSPSEINMLIKNKNNFICKEAMDTIHILWDGTIYPCCILMGNEKPISEYDKNLFPNFLPYDIYSSTLNNIWMDKDYYNFRYTFLNDNTIKLCSLCNIEKCEKPPDKRISIN